MNILSALLMRSQKNCCKVINTDSRKEGRSQIYNTFRKLLESQIVILGIVAALSRSLGVL